MVSFEEGPAAANSAKPQTAVAPATARTPRLVDDDDALDMLVLLYSGEGFP
jgi:hypothetical protein